MSKYAIDYHNHKELELINHTRVAEDVRFDYDFQNFFHPYVGELIAKLNRESLDGVFDAAWQKSLIEDFFANAYKMTVHPIRNRLVDIEAHPKEIDVSLSGPYANYNWELLFHVPFTIAVHLSKTQRCAEAQRWFHYIFDPTSTDTSIPAPARFWKFLAFRNEVNPRRIEALLTLMSKDPSELTAADAKIRQETIDGYHKILDSPFQPHAVARTRIIAYQYCTVMKYLDNLITWGDSLFQQDTVESINEATQLYVLAANLLGPRPQKVPSRGDAKPMTFAQIRNRIGNADNPMMNPLVELEGQFTFNGAVPSSALGANDPSSASPLFGLARTLYFCIPRNEKMLSYWDQVVDRLFKIRHGMTLAGIVRPQALFDPPIDPGMLVKAAAAGLDLGSVIAGLYQPPGPVRCAVLVQKAIELSNEVRGLGAALLAALEKGDAEHMALVRQKHEMQIHELTRNVRFLQYKAAQEATKSLLTNRAAALERLNFYKLQLGLPDDPNAPADLPIDFKVLNEVNFDQAYAALVAQYDKKLNRPGIAKLRIAGESAPSQQSGASGAGQTFLSTNEDEDLNRRAPNARDLKIASTVSSGIAQALAVMPDFGVNLHFWGLGANAKIIGGSTFAAIGNITAAALNTNASDQESRGASAAKTASYERRGVEWQLQYNLAAHELMQMGRQILTSLIAEQVTYHDYLNVHKQFENSQEIDRLLHDKFTNKQLHLWMQGELSRLYYDYYRFAFDTARKAEAAVKRELMRPEVDAKDFIKFNYWDGGRKGLLSGEALHFDLKRLEMAYLEHNQRELELTRHVSLRQLAPMALLALKATGTCTVQVPEWLFDRDTPGHYMRRIKTVALTIPCVAGPYTGVHCTLSLVKSSLRGRPDLKDGAYERQGPEDDRFIDYPGGLQSMVTSHANNDAGMFDTVLRDERLLPFEGAGAESTWKLDLPKDHASFDFATISDVILHIRYTARTGIPTAKVSVALSNLFKTDPGSPLVALFSLRHDFPTAWAAFLKAPSEFRASVPKDFFPYLVGGKTLAIEKAIVAFVKDDKLKEELLKAGTHYAFDAASETFLSLTIPESILARDASSYLVIKYNLN